MVTRCAFFELGSAFYGFHDFGYVCSAEGFCSFMKENQNGCLLGLHGTATQKTAIFLLSTV
jgi:hypothetical protein